MNLNVIATAIENPSEVQEVDDLKQITSCWTDEKFQELLREKWLEIDLKPTKTPNGLTIRTIVLSKKQLNELINITIKIYGGLYANGTPSYAQRYPDESRINFMQRWDRIISSLENFRDRISKNKIDVAIVRL